MDRGVEREYERQEKFRPDDKGVPKTVRSGADAVYGDGLSVLYERKYYPFRRFQVGNEGAG